ncbi:MAG: hypothetical protein IKD76_05015 [Clostridia bacterium]|nr:hypothetical protein [Clostridia bacterium]
MERERKNFVKVASTITIIAILAVVVLSTIIPMKLFKSENQIANGFDGVAEAKYTGQVTGWRDRVYGYPSRLGRHYDVWYPVYGSGGYEQKWLFEDSENEYNDLYCIESGETHANTYNIYDLYSFGDDEIEQYFGSREKYRHFMWILENMYTTNTNNQGDIEKNLIENKLSKIDGNVQTYYNGMLDELKARFPAEEVDGDFAKLPLYITGTDGEQPEDSTYNIKLRDLLIKLVQNYSMLQYVIQDNSNEMYSGNTNKLYGVPVLDYREDGYNVFDIGTFSENTNDTFNEFSNETNTKKFARVLAEYLVNSYNDSTYNLDKYKGFYDSNYTGRVAITQNADAEYNSETRRIGPYTISNYYGFYTELKSVKSGNTEIGNCKVVDENGDAVTLKDGTSGYADYKREFYIELPEEASFENGQTLSVEFNIDYSEVPKASIYIPADDTVHPQIVVNVKRTHEVDKKVFTLDVEGDIALKKYIYKVNDSLVDTRLDSIDTEALDSGADTNAKYKMKKSPVEVNLGDTVLYRIQTFNEGNVAGRAEEIRDYLPSGLEYLGAYSDPEGENVIEGVTKNEEGNIIVIPNPNESRIPAYNKGGAEELINNSQSIYVKCKVTGLFDGVYTNVSEITKYDFELGTDRDSQEEDWQISVVTKDDDGHITSIDNTSSEWKEYSNNQGDKVNSSDFDYFYGQQDDDDFDKIVVGKLDLALTKKINYLYSEGQLIELTAGGVSKDKEELSDIAEVKDNTKNPHTLKYTMNKELASVERGNVIVSTITVYNEGNVKAAVKEVTDFVPAGLEFNEEVTRQLNDGKGIELYNTDVNSTIKVIFSNWQILNAISEENEVDSVSFKLAFTVSDSAEGNIINSAAITKYGYKSEDSEEPAIEAKGVGQVDVDSEQEIRNKNTIINAHLNNMIAVNRQGATSVDKVSIDVEDDDDADGVYVEVERKFDLALRKYISKIGNDTYDRAPKINNNSVGALNRTGTAEYYHKKNKLYAKVGDLVTYKIRIYNEGQVYGNTEDYAGRATQIKDYLPEGIEFVELEDDYKEYWDANYNADENVVVFNIKDANTQILQPGSIEGLASLGNAENGKQYYQEIGVICKVIGRNSDANSANITVLTNRAGITGYEVYNSNNEIVTGVSDRDSGTEDLDSTKLDDWYNNTVQNESNPNEYYPGRRNNEPKGEVEDNNDFDTIYVSNYSISFNKHYGSRKVYDGNDILKGTTFEIKKYSYVEGQSSDIPANGVNDLDDVETSIFESGIGSYYSAIPSEENGYDVYIIKETQSVEGYNNYLADKYIKLTLKHDAGLMKIVKTNGLDFEIYTNDNVYVENDETNANNPYEYVDIKALGVANNNEPTATFMVDIDNTGDYKLKIGKKSTKAYTGNADNNYATSDENYLEGATFEIKQYLNQTSRELLEEKRFPQDIEDIDDLLSGTPTEVTVTSEAGTATGVFGNIEITNYNAVDVYVIKETSAPSNYKIDETVYYLKVYKTVDNTSSKWEISRIEVYNGSQSNKAFNAMSFGTMENVNTTVEGEGLWAANAVQYFRVDLDKNTNTITFTKANEKFADGTYKVLLNKVDESGSALNNAKFSISAKEGTEGATITTPIETAGTPQTIIENAITEENVATTDEYEIEETKAPAGYFNLKNKIDVEVEKEFNESTQKYTIKGFKVNGVSNDPQTGKITIEDVELDGTTKTATIEAIARNSEITITVSNVKIPEPEIHKGVKTVENQDSGYFYNDLVSGETYTEEELKGVVHDWVVETTIPEGINQYTKYVVEDSIDLTKLVPYKGNEDNFEDNVKVYKVSPNADAVELTKGTDYKISYEEDEENKKGNLCIKYIEDENFKGDFLSEITAEDKLRVVFNTTFKVDENGMPVVLSGTEITNAENQANLIYNIDNKEDKKKESETPEVHTGKASVFKYKDVNGNGEYDRGIDEPLQGAVFRISYAEDCENEANLVTDVNGNPLVAISNEDGIATFTGLEFGGDATTEGTTDENGLARYDWENASKTYYIFEYEAPAGYTKSEKVVPVTVSKNSSEMVDISEDLQFANIERTGTYQILINKVDENNVYLKGAQFEVTGPRTATINSPVETNGTMQDITIVESDITENNVGENNRDKYVISEIASPKGYFKLKNPIEVEVENIKTDDAYKVNKFIVNGQAVTSKVKIENLVLEGTDKTTYMWVNPNRNSLTITIGNVKVPEPEIHKGVKTVENQDSGYFYNDLVSGKTYSEAELKRVVHDWVIETTVPEGINKYTKYAVEDAIDLTKLVPYKGDKEDFVNNVKVYKVSPNADAVELTKDTDYKIAYEEDAENKKGNLRIEYIIYNEEDEEYNEEDEDFRGDFLSDITTEDKLRVVFNTTFKVDENGIPVVLNGKEITNAENQASLIYNIDKGKDIRKESEKPEVHTGRASIFKYKDVNENGEYDKGIDEPLQGAVFKIAYDEKAKNLVKGVDGKDLQAVSNEDGIATFTGLQFGGDATDEEGRVKYNWETAETKYYIFEAQAPAGYIKSNDIVEVTVSKNSSEKVDLSDKLDAYANRRKNGVYDFTITKLDSETNEVIENEIALFDILVYSSENFTDANVVTLKDKQGNTINTTGIETKTNGVAEIKDIAISSENIKAGIYYFVIEEIKAPDQYTEINYRVVVPVKFTETESGYVATHLNKDAYALAKDENGIEQKKALNSMATKENECVSTEQIDLAINVNVPNKLKKFDLSLRKFITAVNDKAVEVSREPVVDASKLVSGEATTAEYTHTKNPILVTQKDVVEYTIRVYNEGEMDGYADLVLDDVPIGVEMIAPEYTSDGKANNINAEYRWIMCREVRKGEDVGDKETFTYDKKVYVITDNASEAEAIVTDYLSRENGKVAGSTENSNLLKAFNPSVGEFKEENYRDIKVQFRVKETKQDKLIINHAQIAKHSNANGEAITDIDSTPNEWENPPRDDDQDYDVIKVGNFDLALYKWVSSSIVTEDGKTKEYNSGHKQNDKSKVVNINVPNNKIKDVVVKFKYKILVENQGTIDGNVCEIKDHIPEGLKFLPEDNKEFGWVLNDDGTVTTDYLKNTVLKPNETAEVTIVLTWINGSNNLGKKVNYAEISSDYNVYGWPDIDSVPDNLKGEPKEDDEDKDVVMLQVRTGNNNMVLYVAIGVITMSIILSGVVAIKKFVLQ